MATWIEEFHGATPGTSKSRKNADSRWCPFVDTKCKKTRSGGACALKSATEEPVIICPNRLYGDRFKVIAEVAQECFGAASETVSPDEMASRFAAGTMTGNEIMVYGQGFAEEISIASPSPEGRRGSFKVDYILAKPSSEDLSPVAIVAIEVQSIDTTNSYKDTSNTFYATPPEVPIAPSAHPTTAGFNWENVNKRILPQVIYKGHALRRERLATHGLFFILPDAVFQRILTRLGGKLSAYPQGLGTVTFKTYKLGDEDAEGTRPLEFVQRFTTTVDQLAYAFVSPQNLPPEGAYENLLIHKAAKLTKR
ncbi:NotI family restriction endonuclease [Ponticaulis sp.]|uniref:NotI family restriction endonuclease n=1 Tax=Ponticaulis sp. TaxID=2020902 RepID=UPI00261AC402|nr:NotI family restriction endonuclease [Ponticaulis sp.]MDF1681752.1 NotI family restriction endonuclease [Ponticaulis sp.]